MTIAAGTLLGPYKIVSFIGKGGMGEVYLASDERLGRNVAIKVLPGETSRDSESLKRLSKEAKALATLSHPNIVTIYDVGTSGGISFVVMEYLEGQTLRDQLIRTGLPWRKALEIAIPVGDALSAAHSKGVIHKDLKPENIFLTSTEAVKILDFGLARFKPVVAENQMTQTPTLSQETSDGKISGTLQYMSPEHLQGAAVDARSDIFSFGCVLYEMITGQRPFSRKSVAETIAAILKENPANPAEVEKDISPELEHIIYRCLEKNPNKRFQSAADLAFALRELLSTSSVSKASVRQELPAPKTSLFRYASILLLVLLLAGIAWWFLGRTNLKQKTRDKSIAVLPFRNMNPDKESDYFSDGITEDVLTQLSKIGDLRVISRTSIMRYKNTNKTLQQIGKELKVATILEGSVRREGNRLRIVGQLIDAQTDEHIWAETYDREMKDIFQIQSDVALQIANALKAKLSSVEKERIERKPTDSVTAYDYYLKGRQYYMRFTNKDNENAIQLFKKAVDVDPNYALAYAGLGHAYMRRKGSDPAESPVDLAMDACDKAIALDPNLADAYDLLQKIYNYKGWSRKAFEAQRKAVELNPNYGKRYDQSGGPLHASGES